MTSSARLRPLWLLRSRPGLEKATGLFLLCIHMRRRRRRRRRRRCRYVYANEADGHVWRGDSGHFSDSFHERSFVSIYIIYINAVVLASSPSPLPTPSLHSPPNSSSTPPSSPTLVTPSKTNASRCPM